MNEEIALFKIISIVSMFVKENPILLLKKIKNTIWVKQV